MDSPEQLLRRFRARKARPASPAVAPAGSVPRRFSKTKQRGRVVPASKVGNAPARFVAIGKRKAAHGG